MTSPIIPQDELAAVARITEPFRVAGCEIKGVWIADAIDRLANIRDGFQTSALSSAFFPDGDMPFFYARSEALNRLFQRWRRLGLVEFRHGRWHLTKGAWGKMHAQAIETRRAETERLGAKHEHAVGNADAPGKGQP